MSETLLLFDIDGTLLTTGGSGLVALNAMFEELYQKPNAFNGVSFVGSMDSLLLPDAYRQAFGRDPTPHERDTMAAVYVRELRTRFDDFPFTVFPGVRETLDWAREQPHLHLGIATGNLLEGALAKLEHAGLEEYFSFGGYGFDGIQRSTMTQTAIDRGKAHVGIADGESPPVLVFGDSVYDIRAAHATGSLSIALETGWTDRQTLLQEMPTHILSSFEDTRWRKLLKPAL